MRLEHKDFSTSDELGAYLKSFGIPIENWGKGISKEVFYLHRELLNGDSELIEDDGSLIRRAHFVNISIYAEFDGIMHTLIEDRQVFNEGTSEERVRIRKELG